MDHNQIVNDSVLVTAGSSYLDIDAYACAVAMAELLRLQGVNAVAYSKAPFNYSVCATLMEEGQIMRELPSDMSEENASYILVDVSDPEFLKSSVPLDRVVSVYDHHVGFEDYWHERIGDGAHIEFIGAAATLIYRQWKREGQQEKMSPNTARLLVAAILDNTLNLTSSNTTDEDREAYAALCIRAGVDAAFRASYFSEVQKNVEVDLKNALFGDLKTVRNNPVLPSRVAQLCVWNAESILARLSEIREWFENKSWMINIIDLARNCSYFVCDDKNYQKGIEKFFDARFKAGVAKLSVAYLRKEIIQIIKKTMSTSMGG